MTDGTFIYNGYTLGDNEITFMDEINGWDDLPPVETGNAPISMGHGSSPGRAFARERIVTWSGSFSPPVKSTWATDIAALRAAFCLEDEERLIQVTTLDETLVAYGAVRSRAIPGNRSYGLGKASIAFQFVCSDPRRYTPETTSVSIGFPAPGIEGLDYPLVYPLDYGDPLSLGTGSFENVGDASLPIVIRLNGPCENPSYYNQTTNRFITFSISLTEDEYLEVDTKNQTVLLNGTTDRLNLRSTLSSPLDELSMAKGVNSLRVSAASWSGAANAVVTGHSGAYF